jgi:hypothetical protein
MKTIKTIGVLLMAVCIGLFLFSFANIFTSDEKVRFSLLSFAFLVNGLTLYFNIKRIDK